MLKNNRQIEGRRTLKSTYFLDYTNSIVLEKVLGILRELINAEKITSIDIDVLENIFGDKKAIKKTYKRMRHQGSSYIFNLSEEEKRAITVKTFYFVRDTIPYNIFLDNSGRFDIEGYMPRGFKASYVLKRGQSFCIPKAVLLASMLRATGINARLHFADIVNYRTGPRVVRIQGHHCFFWHGYVEVLLSGKWIKLTPAFDKGICERNGFPIVEFDGYNDAVFARYDDEGHPFIEYVNDRGVYYNVPYVKIISTWFHKYGIRLLAGYRTKKPRICHKAKHKEIIISGDNLLKN